MGEEFITSWPLVVCYLATLTVATAILRRLGYGWGVVVPIALVVAAIVPVLVAFLVSKGHRR